MNRKIRLALAAMVATGAPLAASAGDIYVGAGIGDATYKSADFVDCFGECNSFSDNDFAYNLFVGYSVTDAVAVELGWQDWGNLKDNLYGEEVKVEPTMFTVMAVGTAPIAEGFSVFGKAGVAFVNVDTKFDGGEGGSSGSNSINSQELALGGGIQWDMGSFGVRAEALWVDAEDSDKAMMFGVAGLYKFKL